MHKKLYAFLAVLLVAVLLVSCAPAQPAPAAEEKPAAVEEAPAAEEPAAEEVAEEPAEKVTLVINSWRNDDLPIWQDVLIPAFNKHHPEIEVIFSPDPPAEYNGALSARLEGGTAGDLITCRPFDQSLALFNQGYLTSLNDLPGMENFPDSAKVAWQTDDASTVFCVPMASVIHGFIYNKAIFEELGLEPPTTEAEFYAVLEAIKADGNYVALDIGTKDLWEAATMGFQNIGPMYWKGEEGRLALIAGTAKFTDPEYVAVWDQLNKWGDYTADGYESQSYVDSQNLFTLGMAAIYPAGSWDVGVFNAAGLDFEMGAFPPYLPEGSEDCYISDHTDIALGMNAKAAHPEEAKLFLEWMTTEEFAELYSNQLPGFYSLSKHEITVDDPVANEFLSWRKTCGSTIRNSYAILSRGEPNLENELWAVSALAINQAASSEEIATRIEDGLASWYGPHQ